jgi:hypothetical protein
MPGRPGERVAPSRCGFQPAGESREEVLMSEVGPESAVAASRTVESRGGGCTCGTTLARSQRS